MEQFEKINENVEDIFTPTDADATVNVSADKMMASIFVFSPKHGGQDISEIKLREALNLKGVVFGINEDLLKDIVSKKMYNEEITIAKAKQKTDGTDAFIEEYFEHELKLEPFKNPDGTVDFKTLNIIREVKMGVLIAKKTPATQGVDGTTVLGTPIVARQGKDINIQVGENTRITDDGLELYTNAKGNLVYKGNRFNVETLFIVDGNVDNNTGNLIFSGDILVKGDVFEGYTIKAKGQVHVKGGVQGGIIQAGGDVIVDGGFNGMTDGEITSKHNIKAKFLQNCKANAQGNIEAEAVINSYVNCNGDLIVTSNKGVITGGKCNVLHRVEAKVIGSEINTPTRINIGVSPQLLEEKNSLNSEILKINENNDLIEKNLKFIEYAVAHGESLGKYKETRDVCSKQKIINMINLSKHNKRLEEINNIIEESNVGSEVRASQVFPSTKISFASISTVVKKEIARAVFRVEDGEIKVSTF